MLSWSAGVALRIAWTALLRNRLRTTLTGVGVAIGTTAVISTVAIGQGGAAQIHDQLRMLGDNLVWVEAGGRSVNGLRTGTGTTPTLVQADMAAMLQSVPTLKGCSPQIDSSIQIVYGNRNWHTGYRGVSPEYLEIRRWTLADGDTFSPEHVVTAANVCLVGQTVVARLFADEDPVGKTIRVRNIAFKDSRRTSTSAGPRTSSRPRRRRPAPSPRCSRASPPSPCSWEESAS